MKAAEKAKKTSALQTQVEQFAKYLNDPVGFCADVLGIDLVPKQCEAITSILKPPYRTLIPSANEQGKCVEENELLTLADGSRVRAGDLVGKQFKLPTLVGGEFAIAAARADWNAIEPVYELTTEYGHKIIRNGQHPIWSARARFQNAKTPAVSDCGWHNLSTINESFVVAVANEMPVGGQQQTLADDELKIAAYLIGDGGLTASGINFTQAPNVQLEEFKASAIALGSAVNAIKSSRYGYGVSNADPSIRKRKQCKDYRVVSHSQNPVRILLKRLGLMGKHSRDKFVPDEIMRQPLNAQALFLNRLFSTDGWACVSKGGCPEIGFCSISERLIRDVHHMLIRFGLHFKIRRRHTVDAWVISIQDGRQVVAFAEKIGIFGKETGLRQAVDAANGRGRQRHLWRERISPGGTRWEKVISVRCIGEARTVAVEVPEHHTFITPIYEHNSLLCACAVLWWHCTRSPSIIITTAPKYEQVRDVIWKEVRRLAADSRLPIEFLPKACRIERASDDFATGTTARDSTSFQGQHGASLLFILDEACHDDQTDVMTEHGWKRFADLDGSERLMTMDPETHIAEMMLPDRIVKKYHVGEMFEYRAKGANWCVTPNHNMFWRKSHWYKGEQKYGPWMKTSMEDVASRVQCHMTRTVNWLAADVDTFTIPGVRSARKLFADCIVNFDDFAIFLGWYCSEGCLLKAANGLVYGAAITQNAGNQLDEIEAVCERLGFRPKRYMQRDGTVGQIQIHSLQIGRWLSNLGKNCLEKMVPDCIRLASARQIGLFLDSYLKGDGYRKNGTNILYTSSRVMADGLQELIIKTGADSHLHKRPLAGRSSQLKTHTAVSSVDGYVVSWHTKQGVKFKSKNLRRIQYDGYVWCAALPKHHLLLTRRDGNVIWSGNTGIEGEMFDAVEGMFSPPGHAILAPFNPTAVGTRVHSELMFSAQNLRANNLAGWHVVRMSALDHPNIRAQLDGRPPVVEHAMRIDKFERLLKRWSRPVGCDLADGAGLHKATDVLWPPLPEGVNHRQIVREARDGVVIRLADGCEQSVPFTEYCRRTGQRPAWYRPGPMAEARLLGRYPTQGVDAVWSDGMWISAMREGLDPLPVKLVIPEIGCDVAAYGDDSTAIHVRCGFVSLHHEEINGQSEPDTMARLIELAKFYASFYNEMLLSLSPADRGRLPPQITPYDIPIKIDNDGLGGTLSSFMESAGWKVIRIGASTKAIEELNYPNRRSELWFTTAEMADDDQIDLSRLDEEVIEDLRGQLMQVTWEFDNRGRRKVMPKDEMRAKMGRSPDSADAMNLAYAAYPDDRYGDAMPEVITRRRNPLAPTHRFD